jgi:hypothetical protein
MKEKEQVVKTAKKEVLNKFWITMPYEVKYNFKSFCAKRGKSMKKMIIKLMKDAMNESRI